jgi:hypothetical protein
MSQAVCIAKLYESSTRAKPLKVFIDFI